MENQRMSPPMKQIVLGIVAASLALALLSNIQYPSPNTNRFLLSHTLDPTTVEDRGYQAWGGREWVDWLNRREKLHTSASERGSRSRERLNQKQLNTVVIASPAEIIDVFQGHLEPYGSGMVWSNRALPTYHFRKRNKKYDVYRCPSTFIAVRLVQGKAVHLQTFNTYRIVKGNPNFAFKRDCTLLQ